ncbi:glutamate racemase [Acetilactobacillus jinshanensis]|uniref:Glutamate racemase n=1 Tax=Acetilactobacillus jinshanensis TaxID=1720083 RepID=A0A4P6ZKG9_9LACO|nr:glutamate racemase [Acetilactobacillus jinshanensis]QBP18053.1 glutamate racemase [Acetilactobacillus jinshanensis]URL60915.1 glutamate racemase [uncultured bacterium]
MNKNQEPIGVMDSGVGGTSTLKTLAKMLPHEDFVFYGDSKNAPYGERSKQAVVHLTNNVFNDLTKHHHIKAFVIACNTATSSAKSELVKMHPNLPIFGIEPALKQAVDNGGQNIAVMATPLTMSLPKYNRQLDKYQSSHRIFSVPCPGLAGLIEGGSKNLPQIKALVHKLLDPLKKYHIDSVVLGCTHYPYIRSIISHEFNDQPAIYTGYDGLARYVGYQLKAKGLAAPKDQKQIIKFTSSNNTPQQIKFYSDMYHGKILK